MTHTATIAAVVSPVVLVLESVSASSSSASSCSASWVSCVAVAFNASTNHTPLSSLNRGLLISLKAATAEMADLLLVGKASPSLSTHPRHTSSSNITLVDSLLLPDRRLRATTNPTARLSMRHTVLQLENLLETSLKRQGDVVVIVPTLYLPPAEDIPASRLIPSSPTSRVTTTAT